MIILYETGIEEPERLGSGSNYYSVFTTKDEDEAISESMKCGRNYLSKVIYDKGCRQTLEYNYTTHEFE